MCENPFFKSLDIVKKFSPPGGLEPPTFRLTAERASRLRHGGLQIREFQKNYIAV